MKRKLLFLERLMYGNGQKPFNGVFVVNIKGTFTHENLRNALAKVQAKHPLLRSGIIEDSKGVPYFVLNELVQEIPISQIERTGDDDWIPHVKAAWAHVFDLKNGPMAKIVWLKGSLSSNLILAFHHCMCDGGAGLMLIQEILSVLDQPLMDIGYHRTYTTIDQIIPASVLTDKKAIRKAKLVGTIVKTVLYVSSSFIQVKNKDGLSRENDYLIHWKLGKEESAALFNQCTNIGATVNTALCVAFLTAFQQIKNGKTLGKITCPVDIRKFVPEIKKDTIFSFGLSLSLSMDKNVQTHFWDKVKTLQNQASAKMGKMDPYNFLMTLENAHAGLNNMRKVLTHGKSDHDLMFSNMGRLNVPKKYETFEIETIYSPTVIGPLGNPNTIITSTYNNQIDFSFVSNSGYLAYQDAEAIKNAATELLLQNIIVPRTEEVFA